VAEQKRMHDEHVATQKRLRDVVKKNSSRIDALEQQLVNPMPDFTDPPLRAPQSDRLTRFGGSQAAIQGRPAPPPTENPELDEEEEQQRAQVPSWASDAAATSSTEAPVAPVPAETHEIAIEKAFSGMDADGDGEISAEELLNGVLELRAANTKLEARLANAERDARMAHDESGESMALAEQVWRS
jgi:hypothetical protein